MNQRICMNHFQCRRHLGSIAIAVCNRLSCRKTRALAQAFAAIKYRIAHRRKKIRPQGHGLRQYLLQLSVDLVAVDGQKMDLRLLGI